MSQFTTYLALSLKSWPSIYFSINDHITYYKYEENFHIHKYIHILLKFPCTQLFFMENYILNYQNALNKFLIPFISLLMHNGKNSYPCPIPYREWILKLPNYPSLGLFQIYQNTSLLRHHYSQRSTTLLRVFLKVSHFLSHSLNSNNMGCYNKYKGGWLMYLDDDTINN